MNPTPPPTHLRQLAAELVVPKPMRRGCVSERTIRCHKPGCACADDPKARHGPYVSLTRTVHGKTCILVTDNEKHFPTIDLFNPLRGASGKGNG